MTILTRAAASFGRAFLSPAVRATAFAAAAGTVGATVVAADNKERSLILCKPDAVQRGLVHKIIGRFEERGYKLVAIRLVTPSEDLAKAHYADLKVRPPAFSAVAGSVFFWCRVLMLSYIFSV